MPGAPLTGRPGFGRAFAVRRTSESGLPAALCRDRVGQLCLAWAPGRSRDAASDRLCHRLARQPSNGDLVNSRAALAGRPRGDMADDTRPQQVAELGLVNSSARGKSMAVARRSGVQRGDVVRPARAPTTAANQVHELLRFHLHASSGSTMRSPEVEACVHRKDRSAAPPRNEHVHRFMLAKAAETNVERIGAFERNSRPNAPRSRELMLERHVFSSTGHYPCRR